jgi:hypothetical protein
MSRDICGRSEGPRGGLSGPRGAGRGRVECKPEFAENVMATRRIEMTGVRGRARHTYTKREASGMGEASGDRG